MLAATPWRRGEPDRATETPTPCLVDEELCDIVGFGPRCDPRCDRILALHACRRSCMETMPLQEGERIFYQTAVPWAVWGGWGAKT